jgi:hypothetical protein
MTQPKMKQLVKLLREWSMEVKRGEHYAVPSGVGSTDQEPMAAEIVDVIARQVERFID